MSRKYLSCTQGKSIDGCLEYVKTNGGNYYQPIMVKVGKEFIVVVYECSQFGHINYDKCTYTAHWQTEREARHDIMACHFYLSENGIPNHAEHDKPSVNEYADLEWACMNYENGLTPMDI